MKNKNAEISCWSFCTECYGTGKKSQKLRKKVRLRYKNELALFKKSDAQGKEPVRPKPHLSKCAHCSGSGLIQSKNHPLPDTHNYPHIAIIGGGIGGVALAVACLHRGIPFTLYERDANFDARSQGYGLTLQQASKAIEGLGLFTLKEGVVSTRHVVHNTSGEHIGEWGMRKWLESGTKKEPKRSNIHIARQSLRLALLEQLDKSNAIAWNHQLTDIKKPTAEGIDLNFMVNGEQKTVHTDLVVGADGIRSTVRSLVIGEQNAPLRYLECIVILGICPLKNIAVVDRTLLDGETVFQTANGTERIYMMPYTLDSVMWQLSFPLPEEEAKALSSQGPKALKEEACRRTQWHSPIPQILAATKEEQISGYPVYDRELLHLDLLENAGPVTLLGDAAHPMSPFKGQGANQALLDALLLARSISKGCRPFSNWKAQGLRKCVLTDFETEMLKRSSSKVNDSADAAQFLHSESVLQKVNAPRGKGFKK